MELNIYHTVINQLNKAGHKTVDCFLNEMNIGEGKLINKIMDDVRRIFTDGRKTKLHTSLIIQEKMSELD